jgi:hypothetical protein
MRGQWRGDDQDLARSAAVRRDRHRLLDLAEVVGGVNRGLQLALHDEPGDLAEERSTLPPWRRPEPAGEPEAAHRQVSKHERVWLHRAGRIAHAAVVDQNRISAQAVGEASRRSAADRIDAEADLCSAGRLSDPAGEMVVVGDDDIPARCLHDRGRILPADNVDRPVATVPGELHQVEADRRVGRVLDHPLAWIEPHELAQEQRRRGRVDRHHGQLVRVRLVRQLHELRCLGDDVRRPAAAAARQQHRLADLWPGSARAELGHPSDPLPASDRRQRRQVGVVAGEGQHIRWIDGCCDHLDQRLAGRRARRLELHHVDHVLRHGAAPLVLGSQHYGPSKP